MLPKIISNEGSENFQIKKLTHEEFKERIKKITQNLTSKDVAVVGSFSNQLSAGKMELEKFKTELKKLVEDCGGVKKISFVTKEDLLKESLPKEGLTKKIKSVRTEDTDTKKQKNSLK